MDKAKVVKLYKQRKGIPFIAEKTGLSEAEIKSVLNDPTSYIPNQNEEKEKFLEDTLLDVNQILERHEQGQDTSKIASKLRVAESYVQDIIKQGKTEAEIYWRKLLHMPEATPLESIVDNVNDQVPHSDRYLQTIEEICMKDAEGTLAPKEDLKPVKGKEDEAEKGGKRKNIDIARQAISDGKKITLVEAISKAKELKTLISTRPDKVWRDYFRDAQVIIKEEDGTEYVQLK